MTFDLERVRRESMIRTIEYHETLESTNQLAVELLEPLVTQSPSLVLTAMQTAGKGRGTNRWWASAGALTFSVVFDAATLPTAPEQRGLVSLVAGLAVRHAVSSLLPDREVLVKWPNDVLVSSRKICGILVEQHTTSSQTGLIIGIGVNVNNDPGLAPTDVKNRATSIYECTGESHDLTDVLVRILDQLNQLIQKLTHQSEQIIHQLNEFNTLHGKQITVEMAGQSATGICQGIDESGQLILANDESVHRITAGVVTAW